MISTMTRAIAPGTVVSRIWELYQREAGTLLPVAVALFAVQFLVAIKDNLEDPGRMLLGL